jgi:hypothetical protein
MTTHAAYETTVRPAPWPRLGWVAWRHYRSTLTGACAAIIVMAVYLLINGLRMRSAYDAYLGCAPASSPDCNFAWQTFRDGFGQPDLLGVIPVLLPGIIGVFAGAPILARELETGTFRYAWTQGVGRMRWALALLVPGMLGVAALTAALGAVVSWYNQPLVESGIVPRLRSTVFPATGIAAPGWALAGFALGVVAGLLWRRVLPAVASACAVWFGLAFLAGGVFRLSYRTMLTTTSPQLSKTDLVLSQWWVKGGARVSDADIATVLRSVGTHLNSGGTVEVAHAGNTVDPVQYLLEHGYQQVTGFQSDSRYWPFQWFEFGWLVTLALLLLGVALWLLRRRPA